jgi:drug/metabolite transporter (DMT)-like permease
LHAFCITLGGIAPFALWNNALAHWPVSRVALFGNLIPVSTMGWAYLTLDESIPSTSFLALLLILVGVLIGQGALHPRLKRWMRN